MQINKLTLKIVSKFINISRSFISKYLAIIGSRISRGIVIWPSSTSTTIPVRIDGPGTVVLGQNVRLGYRPAPRMGNGAILLQARIKGSKIVVGEGTTISNNTSIVAMNSVIIGCNCLIGDRVSIVDCDFHESTPEFRRNSSGKIKPVDIGNNVWIGSQVMILKGVSIGDNTVVGAMSLVTKSFPSNCIVAGNPAKIIKHFE